MVAEQIPLPLRGIGMTGGWGVGGEKMRLYFDRQEVASCDDLLVLYKSSEFESPTRSTVSLFSLLKHGGEVWNRIAGIFAEAHVEFCVDPPLGTGRPSHTDLMLINGERSLALEAKWTEPRYSTVQEWLNQGSNAQNRRAVMTGWLQWLQSQGTKPLELEAFRGAVYQMVHRAASACAVGKKPALADLRFSPWPDGSNPDCEQLPADLRHLHGLLGSPEGFPFRLIEVLIKPTRSFAAIASLPKGRKETAAAVKQALRGDALFEFEGVREYLVGETKAHGAGA